MAGTIWRLTRWTGIKAGSASALSTLTRSLLHGERSRPCAHPGDDGGGPAGPAAAGGALAHVPRGTENGMGEGAPCISACISVRCQDGRRAYEGVSRERAATAAVPHSST